MLKEVVVRLNGLLRQIQTKASKCLCVRVSLH